MEAVDFVAELADLLGKSGQVRVRACPLLLARGPLSEQVLFLLAQRRGPLILLGVDGGVPVAQYLLDPLVQLASVGPGALLDCRQPRAERVEGGSDLRRQPGFAREYRRALRFPALAAVQHLDHLLAHPVQVAAQLHQHLGGHALALTDEAEQDVLGADVVVAKLPGLTQRQL